MSGLPTPTVGAPSFCSIPRALPNVVSRKVPRAVKPRQPAKQQTRMRGTNIVPGSNVNAPAFRHRPRGSNWHPPGVIVVKSIGTHSPSWSSPGRYQTSPVRFWLHNFIRAYWVVKEHWINQKEVWTDQFLEEGDEYVFSMNL